MNLRPAVSLVPVSLVLVALLTAAVAGCGDPAADQKVADLAAKVELQRGEMHALEDRFDRAEARARDFEERLAALQVNTERNTNRAAGTVAAAGMPGAADDAGVEMATAADVADALDSSLAKEKIEAVLEEVEAKKRAAEDERRQEQMTTMIAERVRGNLTEELGLNAVQQDTMINLLTDAASKATKIWRDARDSGDPQAFQTARTKSEEIMETVRTDLQGALTTDQYEKLEEMTGGSGMGLMFGGRGGRRGGGGNR